MAEISLIGFAQALFIIAILGARKNKGLNDIILLIFILLIGMKFFGLAGEYKNWQSWAAFNRVGDIFYWCLLGPLLFLFVKTTVQGSRKIRPADLLHLLPLVLVLAAFSGYLINHLSQISLDDWLNENQNFITKSAYNVFILISPIYFIAALVLLIQHRYRINTFYSNARKVNLTWLFYVTLGFGAYLIAGLVGMFLSQFFGVHLPFSVYRYTPAILVLYLFGLGYIGILQLPGFAEYHSFIKQKTDPGTPERYQKSGLTDEVANDIIIRLNRYMEINKPYLDENLNLKSLADAMGTSTHKLSQVLNEQLGQSFFEYINNLRIEEVKKRLNDQSIQLYTLQSVAYDCGFSSKSTFYSTFRKKTGMTPGDYITQKELLNKSAN